jgi:phosphomannomutase
MHDKAHARSGLNRIEAYDEGASERATQSGAKNRAGVDGSAGKQGSVASDVAGWFNVRASNTEPVLRLNAEAKSKSKLDQLVANVTAVISQ